MLKRMTLLFALVVVLISLLASPISAQTRANREPMRDGMTASKSTAFDKATFDQTFTDGKAKVNGVQLHYVIGGSGPPLILMHGWLTTWYEWRHVMPGLAKVHTVVVPDMRGMGDSEKPISGYDKKTVADDIYQLARKLGYQQFDVAGHDLGGMVAYSLAATHRNAVRRLAVVDAALPGIAPWGELVRSPRSWHFAFNNVLDVPEMLMTGHEREFLEWFLNSQAFRPNVFTNTDLEVYTRAFSAPGGLRGGFNYYRAFTQDAKDNAVFARTKLTIPVLGVGGGESGLATRLEENLRNVASNVRIQLIPNSGHWVPDEQPAGLLTALQTFFDKP